MSMTPTAIPSPPVGRAANEKTIEGRTRATTTVKSLAASVSELRQIEGKGHKAAATAKRKEEQDARKVDSARRRAAT